MVFAIKVHVPNRNVGEVFDNIDDPYWYCETLLTEIANEHASLKVKTIRHAQVPYRNAELRRATNHKNILIRKFDKKNTEIVPVERCTKNTATM